MISTPTIKKMTIVATLIKLNQYSASPNALTVNIFNKNNITIKIILHTNGSILSNIFQYVIILAAVNISTAAKIITYWNIFDSIEIILAAVNISTLDTSAQIIQYNQPTVKPAEGSMNLLE